MKECWKYCCVQIIAVAIYATWLWIEVHSYTEEEGLVCKLKVKKKKRIKNLIFLYTGNLKTNTVLENISFLIHKPPLCHGYSQLYIRDQNSLSCKNYMCNVDWKMKTPASIYYLLPSWLCPKNGCIPISTKLCTRV